MGITIYYAGHLKDVNRLPELVNELKDIAKSMGWEYSTLEDSWDTPPDASLVHSEDGAEIKGNLGLRGIILNDPVNEISLDFLFNRDGQLLSPIMVTSVLDGSISPEVAGSFVKTQFSPVELHIWITGLLKYIQKFYMPDLGVNDDSGYWDTGDRKTLEAKKKFIDDKIDMLAGKIQSGEMGDLSGLSAEEIADRIERMLGRKKQSGSHNKT